MTLEVNDFYSGKIENSIIWKTVPVTASFDSIILLMITHSIMRILQVGGNSIMSRAIEVSLNTMEHLCALLFR